MFTKINDLKVGVNRNNKKDLIIDSNFSVLYKPEVTWGLNGGGQLPHF